MIRYEFPPRYKNHGHVLLIETLRSGDNRPSTGHDSPDAQHSPYLPFNVSNSSQSCHPTTGTTYIHRPRGPHGSFMQTDPSSRSSLLQRAAAR
jgi:hypothetical protein